MIDHFSYSFTRGGPKIRIKSWVRKCISLSGYNFGNGFYNDHHFHYGYFIYSAAVCSLDWDRAKLWPLVDVWIHGTLCTVMHIPENRTKDTNCKWKLQICKASTRVTISKNTFLETLSILWSIRRSFISFVSFSSLIFMFNSFFFIYSFCNTGLGEIPPRVGTTMEASALGLDQARKQWGCKMLYASLAPSSNNRKIMYLS